MNVIENLGNDTNSISYAKLGMQTFVLKASFLRIIFKKKIDQNERTFPNPFRFFKIGPRNTLFILAEKMVVCLF